MHGFDSINCVDSKKTFFYIRAGGMLFNVTFNNISLISWRSVLLVEETGVPGENHQPATSHYIKQCPEVAAIMDF